MEHIRIILYGSNSSPSNPPPKNPILTFTEENDQQIEDECSPAVIFTVPELCKIK